MSLLPSTLDFTARDFDSLNYRLQSLIRSVYPDWTDFQVANFGNILLELNSHVGEMLAFYQDVQANEAFWTTLTQRISAIRAGKLIGFTLTGASAATTDETFSLPFVAPKQVVIPEGTKLYTSDPESPLPFRTVAATTIEIGNTSTTVSVEQTTVHSQSYTSSEEPNQEFKLSVAPYLDGSAEVTCDDGDYELVTSFLGYTSVDKVFMVNVDDEDYGHLIFSNGTTGSIPHGSIDVTYKTGGGVGGNVEAGKIIVIEDAIYYSDSTPAPVSCTNALAASGGVDRMTLDAARVQAPASLRVLTRTVSKEDFETVATSVSGVARALMATSNEYSGITENTGKLYVVAQGSRLASGRFAPGTPSSAMLAAVQAEIDNNKPPTITFTYEVLAALFLDVSISARVHLARGYAEATVAAAIRANLQDFFAAQLASGVDNPDINFGANLKDEDGTITGELAWSDIFNVIRDTAGVRKMDDGAQGLLLQWGAGGWLRQDVGMTPIEFPRYASAVLYNASTGTSI